MKKKVAIVSVGDQRHITLISLYTEIFDRENVNYDLICIDRYGEKQEGYNKCTIYQYEFNDKGKASKVQKIIHYCKFSIFAKKIIRRNRYDFIVVWNENTAALLSHYLRKEYAGRYCVNIRDIDFINRPPIKNQCKKAILNSAFSTICTPAPFDFPSNYKYVLALSRNDKILKECNPRDSIRKELPIRISFIGKIRFYDADKYLIDRLANDNRFQLQFFGVDSELYQDYIDGNGIKNVVLVGRYHPEQTKEFLEKTDIIHAYYGTNYPGYRLAAPIKFGYAPALNIPALVTYDTYLDDIGKKYGFTFSIDGSKNNANFADELFEWYQKIDFEQFKSGCEAYRKYVDSINNEFETTCINTIVNG